MSSWMCDGVPKDGKQYPNATEGGHPPYENFSSDCLICGLPQEAMQGAKPGKAAKATSKTVVSSSTNGKPKWIIPAIAAAALLLLVGGGIVLSQLFKPKPTPTTSSGTISPTSSTTGSSGFISSTATNNQLLSQGEKILLDPSPDKQAGASAFAQKDWDGAIAAYQKAADSNPNDPEGKIYLNNAKAQKSGSPITLAVAVPITPSADTAKEILRGVADYQEGVNKSASGKLLEIVIANDAGQLQASSLAQDLVNATTVLGVLGHGIDPGSQQALRRYEAAGLAALSPLTTSVTDSSQPMLKTLPLDQKAGELLGSYLQAVSKTLTAYASKKHSPLSAVIFYNGDSPYSQQLKQQLVKAIPQVKGKLVKEIDITAGTFDADAEINQAKQKGAKVAFLALSKNKVPEAIAIAEANVQAGSPLLLMGGDELYNADILVQGGDAIKGILLAVPWSFQPNDPFAKEAIQSWKGRVSWRTATAYDATKILAETAIKNPTRAAVAQALKQGVPLTGKTTDFGIFSEVPLVEAVPGSNGPPGSKYEFSAVK